jgi:hypothetical protein
MTPHIHAAGPRRRQLQILQLLFAIAAAIAMLALFDAARPDTTGTTLGSVRLTDMTITSPLPATPPSLAGGGLATDDSNDQAQQAEQQALQQMQQSMQQAQEQNDEAEQQFNQDMQQQQTYENQFNDQ